MALVHGGKPTPVGRPIGTSLQLSEVIVADGQRLAVRAERLAAKWPGDKRQIVRLAVGRSATDLSADRAHRYRQVGHETIGRSAIAWVLAAVVLLCGR
jgi:hypothetical protein